MLLEKKNQETELDIQYKNKLYEYHEATNKLKADEIRKELDNIEFKLHLREQKK